MKKESFVLRGGIAFSESQNSIITYYRGYLVCVDGICKGAFTELPEEYKGLPLYDYGERLIIPGMTDLHVHAPQYSFRGIGMDAELLEWLSTYTFPEEAKYSNMDYARHAYAFFTADLRRCFTTRAVVFGTLHNEATIELMNQLEETGLITYVGKVNMDRNGGAGLEEESAETSLEHTRKWLEAIEDKYVNTKPILTPRFIPSCSDELMKGLGKLSAEKDLRIQSHLSENHSEIAWVKELVPESTCYANAYEMFDTMGTPERPTIMAHCVHSDEREMEILKKHGAYIAHCADSNMNLTSGIAPIRKFLDYGINIGLATDVAAGSSMNMVKTMLITLQASKMYYRLVDQNVKPLTFEEVFYLATAGGGSYFGKVGTFKPGYDFDALVIDDSKMFSMRDMSIRERIERMCYNDADAFIKDKFVKGKKVFTAID
ncbi:amidohydrolase family protein [Pseudobutyrivibrio xylanivorans]|uniref:Amidohydrolase family protein n=1 Tax=Pseudobutyrivibrio xylanivorans TaxID=185007 RepID=A0A5P6VT99_PSEXY|nr:amidohydrolase family protein [Pseudobutyrivibrio xylanivorans]QFJ54434.1 amidohydrolase family protein [Pseudobutyrivibrio xylanivorans]